MFKIKESNPEEEEDSVTKSKYFSAGKILNTNTTDCSQSSTSSASSGQPMTQSNSCPKSSQQSNEEPMKSNVEKDMNPSTNRRPVLTGNTLLVNPNQKENKLLKHLRVSYRISEAISPAHYLMYDSCCAVFLSLKYHVIYNNYIYQKLDELRNTYQLKVLLVLVDHIEFQSALKELTQLAIRTNCTLMLAWSYEEAANYLENYRHFADKSADIIMGKSNAGSDSTQNAYQCLTEALSSIKSINKTDAISLISTFDTFENIVKSDDDQLIVCPGMAALKAQRMRQFFYKPFIRTDS